MREEEKWTKTYTEYPEVQLERCTGVTSAVNHPAHYSEGGIEAIDVIEAFDLDFCLGNVVKYILRAGRKDPNKEIEDLNKACWYLNRRIQELEKDRNN